MTADLASVARLATGPGFESVPADLDAARSLLAGLQVDEAQGLLFHASAGRWASANSAAYDIARKSVHALLLAAGRRVRATAGHRPYEQLASDWLPTVDAKAGPRIAKSLASSKKARHAKEYPSPRDVGQGDKALQQLAQDAVRLHEAVCRALAVEVRDGLVPTDTNLELWRSSL